MVLPDITKGSILRKHILRSAIRELDEEWVGGDEHRTWRVVVAHMRLIEEADLAGREWIEAVQFDQDPPPDHVGVGPDDLPY